MASLEDYGSLQKSVVQMLMGYGSIKTDQFEKIFSKLVENFFPNVEMKSESLKSMSEKVIEMINTKISSFDQKIEKYDYGLTNEEFVVFFSSAQTSMSKMQNFYNEAELDFFKLLMTKIIMNEKLNITPRNALNISSSILPKLNKLRVQKLLDGWIITGYLYQHSDNQIYLGAKTLTEFKEFLQKMDLAYCRTCLLCENIACWGKSCSKCETIFHPKCIQKFLSRQQNQKCPSCKEDWEESVSAD